VFSRDSLADDEYNSSNSSSSSDSITFPDSTVAEPCTPAELRGRLAALSYPLLVKPDDSYGSCGISESNVVFTPSDCLTRARMLAPEFASVFAEQFVRGPEFTALITGDSDFEMIEHPNTFSNRIEAPNENVSATMSSSVSEDSDLKMSESLATSDVLNPSVSSDAQIVCPRRAQFARHQGGVLRSYVAVERKFNDKLSWEKQFISSELFWKDEVKFSIVDKI
jgi:hypothetical protein